MKIFWSKRKVILEMFLRKFYKNSVKQLQQFQINLVTS